MVGFKELFNFDDSTPINEAIEKIERLNSVYDTLVDQAKRNSKEYADSLKDILDAANKLEDQLLNLDAAEKKQQETIMDSAAQADKLLKKNEEYTESLKQEQAAIVMLTEQQNKLVSAKEKLAKAQTAEAGSLTALKNELKEAVKQYEAFGDATDASVKTTTLDRIKDLSKAINQGEKALKEAKKATDFAAGSYYDLNQRVGEAKKRLKEMEGGIGSNTKEFKDLQSFIKKGSDQLKEFDKAVGDNQRNVGNYESAFDALDNSVGGVLSQVKNLGKQLLALAANPWFATIAAVVGILALAKKSVTEFFTATGEGEDVLARQTSVFNQFFSVINRGFAQLGKDIANSVGENALTKFLFETLASVSPALAAIFASEAKMAEELVNEINVLGEQLRKNTVDRAVQEANVNKLLLDSVDKIKFSDQQRLDLLKKAVAFKEYQLSIDKELQQEELKHLITTLTLNRGVADFAKDIQAFDIESLLNLQAQIEGSQLLSSEKQQVAESIAKLIELDANFTAEARKNAAKIIALEQEVEKTRREKIERRIQAEQEIQKVILNDNIATNNELLKNANLTAQEIGAIQVELAGDRIKLLELAKEQEIAIVQKAAEERIRAEGKRVETEIKNDEALKLQKIKIEESYANQTEKIYDELLGNIQINYLKELETSFKNTSDVIVTSTNAQIEALNNEFKKGNKSLAEFEKEKNDIIKNGQTQALNETFKFLTDQINAFEGDAQKRIELERKLSEVKRQISEQDITDELQREKDLQKALHDLRQTALSSAISILTSSFDAQDQALQRQQEKLKESYENDLLLAGDNEARKAELKNEFEQQNAASEKKQIEAARKRAQFEKGIALFDIGIKTAQGIAAQLPGFPFTIPTIAAISAIGLLQAAAVLSKPLPAFAEGTDSAPGGWSIINEKGPEAIADSTGVKVYHSKGPMLANLERGSRVYTAEETRRMSDIDIPARMISGFDDDTQKLRHIKVQVDTDSMVMALGRKFDSLEQTIKNKKESHIHYSDIAKDVSKGILQAMYVSNEFK